jgi:anti-anti-sigma factor
METVIETGTPAFGVEGRHSGGVTALRAVGRLVAGAGAGHPAWQAARDWRGASRVVVNLASVTAIDAGGVGALLRLRQSAARHNVPVIVEAAAPRVRRVLQILHLDDVFGLPGSMVPGTEQRSVPGTGLARHLSGGALCRCA